MERAMRHFTLDEKLAQSGNRPTGFDYMRIGLSLAVVAMHSVITSHGVAAEIPLWTSPLRPYMRAILPMFFALSGFLVAGSLLRTPALSQFLGLRAIRVYPALVVEVFLSALVLGPLLTTLPLTAYFSDPVFRLYLLNVTGHIHFLLPGLFHDNPFPDTVNAQLWTVPYELICYIGLSALTLVGLRKRPWIAPAAVVAFSLVYLAARLIRHHGELPFILGGIPGSVLVISFLAGVSIFFYRDRLPWSLPLCVLSGVATALLLSVVPFGDYVVAPVAAYFTVALGVTNPRKLRFLQGADYSYGIYLYGFVIQQTLMAIFPWARIWWLNILLSVPAAALFAACSWHWVEKPALELRRYLVPRGKGAKTLQPEHSEAKPILQPVEPAVLPGRQTL
ncbi:acyltransferase [Mesorhizobium sp. WSM3859]|nr:acyltransferase [Mesorhizobium sp. WSM3859]